MLENLPILFGHWKPIAVKNEENYLFVFMDAALLTGGYRKGGGISGRVSILASGMAKFGLMKIGWLIEQIAYYIFFERGGLVAK